MIAKIKGYLLVASTALTLLVPTLGVAAIAHAAAPAAGGTCQGISGSIQNGVNGSIPGNVNVNCGNTNVDDNAVKDLAKRIITTFSIIVGAASVIMIIYGGFRYIISGGESGRVGAAKNSLIYAIVGLVIVALAQLIIHFVLNQTTTLGS